MLRELLATWENWSAHEALTRALGDVSTDQAREALHRGMEDTPEARPLDALRDSTELVGLLVGWRWQAVHAARVEGANWEQIAEATGCTADQARAEHLAAIDRQERLRPDSTTRYRDAF